VAARNKIGSARAAPGAPLTCLQLPQSRLAPSASGELDPVAEPDSAIAREMRPCGDVQDGSIEGIEPASLLGRGHPGAAASRAQ
jgi:hypothetical protein